MNGPIRTDRESLEKIVLKLLRTKLRRHVSHSPMNSLLQRHSFTVKGQGLTRELLRSDSQCRSESEFSTRREDSLGEHTTTDKIFDHPTKAPSGVPVAQMRVPPSSRSKLEQLWQGRSSTSGQSSSDMREFNSASASHSMSQKQRSDRASPPDLSSSPVKITETSWEKNFTRPSSVHAEQQETANRHKRPLSQQGDSTAKRRRENTDPESSNARTTASQELSEQVSHPPNDDKHTTVRDGATDDDTDEGGRPANRDSVEFHNDNASKAGLQHDPSTSPGKHATPKPVCSATGPDRQDTPASRDSTKIPPASNRKHRRQGTDMVGDMSSPQYPLDAGFVDATLAYVDAHTVNKLSEFVEKLEVEVRGMLEEDRAEFRRLLEENRAEILRWLAEKESVSVDNGTIDSRRSQGGEFINASPLASSTVTPSLTEEQTDQLVGLHAEVYFGSAPTGH